MKRALMKVYFLFIFLTILFNLFFMGMKRNATELRNTQKVYSNDPLINNQLELERIRAYDGWWYNHDASNIRVAIIDSGINYTHCDLIENFNISLSKTFIKGERQEEAHMVTRDHGTNIAGIIGAKGDNNIGVAGICWNVEMVSLKVSKTGNAISHNLVAQAINYANEIGADVINMSFGQLDNIDLKNAIKDFNGLVVCSAGNDGYDNDKVSHFPSNYNLDNIIVVGAMNNYYEPCSFSNYGKTTVDIFAPSKGYTTNHDKYDYGYSDEGTSFAAPYVTGAVALLMSRYPDYTPLEIKDILLSRAKKKNEFKDKCVSGGYLDLADMFHIHNYVYEYINKKQHHRYCLDCEDSFYEDHNWTRVMEYPMQSIPNSFDPNVRMIYECVGCGTRTYGPILGDII